MATAQSATGGGSGHRKLDLALQRAVARDGGHPRRRVIVHAVPGSEAGVQALLQRQGGTVRAFNRSINSFVVDAADIEQMADDPRISAVSSDAPVGALSSDDTVPTRTLAKTLGISGRYTGSGVGVALIDSGLESSSDFSGRITAFYDATGGRIRSVSAYDDYGHGTHVAGLIGGSGARSSNKIYMGMAPGVRFVVLKVLDKNGAGVTSDVINAIEFATANRTSLGINIINLSLGHPVFEKAATDPLVQAVESAVRAGIVVVASAGNFGTNPTTGLVGYAGIASPGNAPSALTVGAVQTQDTVSRADDRIPGYSSRGPTYYDGVAKPDLVAPGHRLVSDGAKYSTLYQANPSLRVASKSGASYMTLSGSSMSAAVTTGVVAQIIEASRTHGNGTKQTALTPNAIKTVLQYTASTMTDGSGANYDRLTQGAGELNAAGALTLTGAIVTSTAVGRYWLDVGVTPSSTIAGQTVIWGNIVVWGNTVLGGNTIGVNRRAFANTVIWGNGLSKDRSLWANLFGSDDTVIWGNSTVWNGDTVVWARNIVWGSTVIWGNAFDDDTVIWGNLFDDDTVIWGNLFDDDTVIWGNVLTNGVP